MGGACCRDVFTNPPGNKHQGEKSVRPLPSDRQLFKITDRQEHPKYRRVVLRRSASVAELHRSRAGLSAAWEGSVRACLLPPQESQDCVSSWSPAEEGARAGDKDVVYVRLLLVFRLNFRDVEFGRLFLLIFPQGKDLEEKNIPKLASVPV